MPHKIVAERNAYISQLRSKRRNEWLSANGPCAKCGSELALEIDHIDPSQKTASPGDVWFWNKEKREAELAKCQVLCHSCHAKKTNISVVAAARKRKGIPQPRPTEVIQLVCCKCDRPFMRRASKERFIKKVRGSGPYCGPVCRGQAASETRWSVRYGNTGARRIVPPAQ